MRTLFSLFGGALVLTEQSGNLTLSWNESLGGGKVKGIVTGTGSIELGAYSAIQLGETDLNALLPAALQPFALVIEGVANTALVALE